MFTKGIHLSFYRVPSTVIFNAGIYIYFPNIVADNLGVYSNTISGSVAVTVHDNSSQCVRYGGRGVSLRVSEPPPPLCQRGQHN